MSFSKNTKKEICSSELPDRYAERALVYGMLLFSKVFSANTISFTTECSAVASTYVNEISSFTCTIVELSTTLHRRGDENKIYSLRIPDKNDCEKIFDFFGHGKSQPTLRINRANIENDDYFQYFLRGVFLICGNVTNPKKNYHLEFVVPHLKLAEDLIKIIEEADVINASPHIVKRKGSYIVYIKESETITDVLTYIGAPMAALEFIQSKMIKSVINTVKRKINSETANLNKTANASAKQLYAIEIIQKNVGLESLPNDLKELAKVRIEHPEYNLRELGDAMNPKISRSGANHRMMRLLEYAEEIKSKNTAIKI